MTAPLQTFRWWTVCPHCGKRHELHDGAAPPVNGDVSFCIDCGEFGIFDSAESGHVRLPTEKEKREIDTDLYAQELRSTWKLFE